MCLEGLDPHREGDVVGRAEDVEGAVDAGEERVEHARRPTEGDRREVPGRRCPRRLELVHLLEPAPCLDPGPGRDRLLDRLLLLGVVEGELEVLVDDRDDVLEERLRRNRTGRRRDVLVVERTEDLDLADEVDPNLLRPEGLSVDLGEESASPRQVRERVDVGPRGVEVCRVEDDDLPR